MKCPISKYSSSNFTVKPIHWKDKLLTMQVEREAGGRISGTVRKPSIRSAEAEERRRGHCVDDAGSAFRAPARPANYPGKLHKILDVTLYTTAVASRK